MAGHGAQRLCLENRKESPSASSPLVWIPVLALCRPKITITFLSWSSPLSNSHMSQLAIGAQARIMEEAVYGEVMVLRSVRETMAAHPRSGPQGQDGEDAALNHPAVSLCFSTVTQSVPLAEMFLMLTKPGSSAAARAP